LVNEPDSIRASRKPTAVDIPYFFYKNEDVALSMAAATIQVWTEPGARLYQMSVGTID
jgi:hypothetical protein